MARLLAQRDPEAVIGLASDEKKSAPLRRAAVALLVSASVPMRGRDPAPAMAAVEKLSAEGGGSAATWIAEEVLAQGMTHQEFKGVMGALAESKELSDDLRKKCAEYVRAIDEP